MSAALLELKALCLEVRDLKRLEQEVCDLREQLSYVDRCTSIERCAAEGTIPKLINDLLPLVGSVTVPEKLDVPLFG